MVRRPVIWNDSTTTNIIAAVGVVWVRGRSIVHGGSRKKKCGASWGVVIFGRAPCPLRNSYQSRKLLVVDAGGFLP